MRKVLIEKTLYNYNELSQDAKEKVKELFIEWRGEDSYLFTEDCEENLKYQFPDSNLQVQYDFSYTQGDGLNIYGELYFSDALNNLRENFTEKEIRTLQFYFQYENSCDMEENTRYTYCVCDQNDYTGSLIDTLEYNNVKNINYKLLFKFEKLVSDFFTALCEKMERNGYVFFYGIDEKEIAELCKSNDYEFFENGSLY